MNLGQGGRRRAASGGVGRGSIAGVPPCPHPGADLPFVSDSRGSRAMLGRLPPLNALKAFEAAARSESFARAAEELCVTPGAVGQQVKALEAALGVRLFHRERQRLATTEAGREYLAVLRDALDR